MREAGTVLDTSPTSPARASMVRAGGLKALRSRPAVGSRRSFRTVRAGGSSVLNILAFRLHPLAFSADCQIAAEITAGSTKG